MESSRLDALRQGRALSWVATLALTAIAAGLRFYKLGRPQAFQFDETYYAKDAWSLVNFGYVRGYPDTANEQIIGGKVTDVWNETPSMVVHPELGKWLIGLGERAVGMDPLGWRVASAIAGALMVLVMVRLARRMTGSTALGLVAGVLLCFDGLHLVLSRLALLDIFVALFVLCAVSCMVADRDWGRARLRALSAEPTRRLPSWGLMLWWRPWRLAAGVCWGLAVSTKWSALFPLAAFGLLLWLWDAGARRAIGVRHAWFKAAILDALPALGYIVALPLLIYVASWTGWLMHAGEYEQYLSNTQYGPYWGRYLETDATGFFAETWQSLRSLWHYHHDVLAFHTKFLNDATHVYASDPRGWLVLNRPVGVDAQLDIQPGAQGCEAPAGSSCIRQVLLLGNPAVWWLGTLGLAWSTLAMVLKRDWRYLLVVVGVASTWLPWFRYDDRPIFSYYAIVALPFLVLGATMLLGELIGRAHAGSTRRALGAAAAGAVLILVIAAFWWFWPIWTDVLLTDAEWRDRMWFERWI